MLINDDEAKKRLNSPINLVNKLKKPERSSKAMSLFGIGRRGFTNPYESQPVPVVSKSTATLTLHKTEQSSTPAIEIKNDVEELVKNADEKIKMELVRSTAVDTLVTSMKQLQLQIPHLESPTKLADVASKMSKIVTDIDNKKDKGREEAEQIHYHFYMPEQKKIEQYEVIDVS